MILVLLALVVAGSALFSGLETGFVSVNRVRLRVRARRGDPAALTLLRLHQRPERVLATFLVGNTICNVGGGALASAWAVNALRGGEVASSVAATLGMSAVFLVLSEMAPKTYFRLRAETAVPRFLWFIKGSLFVCAPVVWVTSALLRVITGRGGRSPFVTREELRQLVRESEGRLGLREQRMLESVFDFGRTVVREVMIPLPEVVSLPEGAATAELLALAQRHPFTRLPVYRERVDRIVGLINVFDVLYARERSPRVSAYVRPIHIVPETSRIHRILAELQRRREAMALVVNEFGSCIGIVTLADIVEEIMGELADERAARGHLLERVGDGYVVDASMDMDDLNAELGLSISKERFDTVGGLVLHQLGHIPRGGERVQVGRLELEVLSAHAYGVRRLRLRILPGVTET